MEYTNRDLIYRVLRDIKNVNADSLTSNRHIYSILRSKADFLIKRDLDSNKASIFNQTGLFKTLYVPMELVSLVDLEALGLWFPINCTIYRSKCKLPNILESNKNFLVKSVHSIDKSVQFEFVTNSTWQSLSKLKKPFLKSKKFAFIENGYLYTPNANYAMVAINALTTSILKDTCIIDLSSKNKDNNSTSVSNNCGGILDQVFTCPNYLIDAVVTMALQELQIHLQLQSDTLINKDDKEKTNSI